MRKYPYPKIKRSPEGEPGQGQDNPIGPEAIAVFILNQLVNGDAQNKADLVKAAALGGQIPILEEIARHPGLGSEEHTAVLAEASVLRRSIGDLHSRVALSEERRQTFLEVAAIPEFTPYVGNALLAELDKTTAAGEILSGIFPGALTDEKAVLTKIADELGIKLEVKVSRGTTSG